MLAAGGCARSVLDSAKAEREVATLVLQATGRRATVSCPSDIPVKTGARTVCTLYGADGTSASATIVQTDAAGHVHISSTLMHTVLVEQKIATDASGRLHLAVRVTCPDLVEIASGSQVRCTAIDPTGSTAPAIVKITDANGSFTYDIPPRG